MSSTRSHDDSVIPPLATWARREPPRVSKVNATLAIMLAAATREENRAVERGEEEDAE